MVKTKFEIYSERLRKVVTEFQSMKATGIDEEIMICYLIVHTGYSRKVIQNMLENIDEFINTIGKEAILDGLEDK